MTKRRLTLLAALMVALAACGSDGTTAADETTSTTEAPTTTATTTEAPTTTATTTMPPTTSTTASTTTTEAPCDPTPLEASLGDSTGAGRSLSPGCHVIDRTGRRLVFEIVDDGVSFIDFPNSVTFASDGTEMSQLDIVLVSEFIGVIPAEKVGIHPPHDEPIGDHMVPIPSDLSTWLDEAPQIVVTDSGEATVAGSPAVWWDLEIDASADETFSCPYGNCVAALVPPPPDAQGSNFVMGDAANFRIVQLAGEGAGILAWIQATPDTFADTLALAEIVLSGMRIDS